MPALTITAIDHITGQFTIPAHGLNTGDGPAALFVPPGSSGVIPSLLAANTDVFVIRVDANTIKLADSTAHAIGGSALSCSDNGTLPLQLLVGIPYRLPRIYVPGVQVKSADLAGNFAAWIALWNLFTGQAQSLWTRVQIAVAVTFNALVTFAAGATFNALTTFAAGAAAAAGQHFKVAGTGRYKHDIETLQIHGSAFRPLTNNTGVDYSINGCMFNGVSTGIGVVAPLPLLQGRRIAAVRFYIRDNPAGPSVLQCQVSRIDSTGNSSGDVSAGSAGNGTDQTITVTPSATRGTVLPQTAHHLKVFFASGNAQSRIYLAEVDFDFQ